MAFRDSLDRDFRRMLVGEFADDAILRASLETVVRVRGIYDNTYLEVDPQTGATVASKKPRVTVFVGDVSFEIRQGHYVTVEARSYKVRDIQPDGLGSASLYLDPVRAGEMNTASAFDDDAPDAADSSAVDAHADATEDLSVEDTASWAGVGERAESDIIALDDILEWYGEGNFPAVEQIDVSDIAGAIPVIMDGAIDRKGVESTYNGLSSYNGALQYDNGATTPALDKDALVDVGRGFSDSAPVCHDIIDYGSPSDITVEALDAFPVHDGGFVAGHELVDFPEAPGFVMVYNGGFYFDGAVEFGSGIYAGAKHSAFDGMLDITITAGGVPSNEVLI